MYKNISFPTTTGVSSNGSQKRRMFYQWSLQGWRTLIQVLKLWECSLENRDLTQEMINLRCSSALPPCFRPSPSFDSSAGSQRIRWDLCFWNFEIHSSSELVSIAHPCCQGKPENNNRDMRTRGSWILSWNVARRMRTGLGWGSCSCTPDNWRQAWWPSLKTLSSNFTGL